MKEHPMFSIIIVCLNPGAKLGVTVDSVLAQTCGDFEIIIKDGLSSDGATLIYKQAADQRIRLIRKPDKGIYDAMNQAARVAVGKYVYFLNCGDVLYDRDTLKKVADSIQKSGQAGVFYGNVWEVSIGEEICANPRLTRFACFRHLPCHQATFYHRKLAMAHPFRTHYAVRADYEQLMWLILKRKAPTFYLPFVIARYEGGGFSETERNRRISAREHREITRLYLKRGEIFLYRMVLMLTLAPLREKLAKNKRTAKFYQKIKKTVYRSAGKD